MVLLDVTMRHCDKAILILHVCCMISQCRFVKLSQCRNVALSLCCNVALLQCRFVALSLCLNVAL